jgi:hypothetical protein
VAWTCALTVGCRVPSPTLATWMAGEQSQCSPAKPPVLFLIKTPFGAAKSYIEPLASPPPAPRRLDSPTKQTNNQSRNPHHLIHQTNKQSITQPSSSHPPNKQTINHATLIISSPAGAPSGNSSSTSSRKHPKIVRKRVQKLPERAPKSDGVARFDLISVDLVTRSPTRYTSIAA